MDTTVCYWCAGGGSLIDVDPETYSTNYYTCHHCGGSGQERPKTMNIKPALDRKKAKIVKEELITNILKTLDRVMKKG
jgi:DnaJ-class molecular chaperone